MAPAAFSNIPSPTFRYSREFPKSDTTARSVRPSPFRSANLGAKTQKSVAYDLRKSYSSKTTPPAIAVHEQRRITVRRARGRNRARDQS